jgi:hypothetical protein
MRHLVISLGVATACTRPLAVTTDATVPTARGIPWFARADLVAFDGGDVVGYAVTDAIVEVGRLRVADAAAVPFGLSGDWADHDDLIVKSDDASVVHITAAGMTALRVPPESEFAAPKPATDGSMELVPSRSSRLVVAPGAAYWSRCAWGIPVDGFQCDLYVHAELWPTPGIQQPTEEPISPAGIKWNRPVPAGFHTEVNERALRCRPPAGAEVELAGTAAGERILGDHWVSVSPPRLLVEYGVFGLADLLPSSWSLYEACGPATLASGTSVVPGSHGLWASEPPEPDDTASRTVIWRGDKRIGVLPLCNKFRFRPER